MNDYQVTAKNYSESSENRIHSDEIAKKFGFKGALVPGVAVYGHLVWPLVSSNGPQWLAQSVDSVRLIKPAYEGDLLTLFFQCQQFRRSLCRLALDIGQATARRHNDLRNC